MGYALAGIRVSAGSRFPSASAANLRRFWRRKSGAHPYPLAEHLEAIWTKDAAALLRDADGAIRENDQGRACAAVQRYGELGHEPKPVIEAPKERTTVDLAKEAVHSVHYSPDGTKLVLAYDSGYVFLGDSAGKKLHDWQLDGPQREGQTAVRFAPDGKHLVMENANATAYILRLPR